MRTLVWMGLVVAACGPSKDTQRPARDRGAQPPCGIPSSEENPWPCGAPDDERPRAEPTRDAAIVIDEAPPSDAPTRAYKLDGEQVEIVALGWDASHRLYAVGTTFGKLTVGAKSVKPAPRTTRRYSFVARFEPDGTLASLVRLDVIGDVIAMAVAGDGSLTLVGHLLDSVGPGPIRHTRADSIVLALGPDGKERWRQSIANKKTGDRALAFAVHRDDSGVVVAGAFEGTMTLGATTLTSTKGTYVPSMDIFVVRYRTDGTVDWTATAGGSDDDGATLVTSTTAGTVLVAGSIGPSATFDRDLLAGPGPSATIANPRHAFIAAYSATGAFAWAREYGTSTETTPRALATRADQSLLFYATESPETTGRHGEQFIAELDARGAVRVQSDVTRATREVSGFVSRDKVLVVRGDGSQLVLDELDGSTTRELTAIALGTTKLFSAPSAFARDPDGRVALALQVGHHVERPLGGGRIEVSLAEVDAILMIAPSPKQLALP